MKKYSAPHSSEGRLSVDDIRYFSQTIASVEWLLLVLVLYFFILHQEVLKQYPSILFYVIAYTIFILGFHSFGLFREKTSWLLSFEIWTMVVFISVILYFIFQNYPAMFNLYFLAITLSAIVCRRWVLALQIAFIIVFYCIIHYADFHAHSTLQPQSQPILSMATEKFHNIIELLAPLVLVAYVISTIANRIYTAKSRLKILSETDQLTRILNMRAFYSYFDKELERSIRHHHEFCLLMIDIDNLKSVNDEYGHEVGNEIIRNVVSCIQNVVRGSDMVARYGGDEFIVLLVETEKQRGKQVVERMHEEVMKNPISAINDEIRRHVKIDVSIGVASYPDDGDSIHGLIATADKAMYHHKKQKEIAANS